MKKGIDRHPDPVLAGPADLHQGRDLQLRRAGHPGPPDLVHRPRPGAGDPRPARPRAGRGAVPPRRRHRRVLRVPGHRRAGQRHPAAAGPRHVHRDRADARRPGPHDPAGRRARPRGRRRDAVGDRLRDRAPVLRQRHRHAQGRHPRRGLRAGRHPDVQRGAAQQPSSSRPTSPTWSRTTSSRGSRRSSPCGWPSHSSRARPRRCWALRPRAGVVRKVVASELKKFLASTKTDAEGAGEARPREGRERLPDPARRPPAPGDPAPQERAGVERAALEARRLPVQRHGAQRAVHRRGRLGAGHGEAGPQLGVPGAAADPRQDPQRPEGLGRRHAQERRVRLDHPGRGRRLRPHLRHRRRAATAGSSSWPTRTPTARTSAACWRRCSSSTCPS